MGQDKDSLMSEGKREKNSDAKAFTRHLPPAARCPASPLRKTSSLQSTCCRGILVQLVVRGLEAAAEAELRGQFFGSA